MATARPEICNPEGVLNFYELQGDERTRFAIYAGHKIAPENCRFEYFGNDKNTGAAELAAICQAIQANPSNTNVYILQVLAEELPKGKIKNPNGSRSVTFQLNNPLPAGYYPAPATNQAAGFGSIYAERLASIESKLEALQQVDDEEEEGQEPANPFLAMFAGLLANPAVQQKIISGITSFIENMANQNQAKQQPQTLAGISSEVSEAAHIATIKTVLPNFDELLQKLAAMAVNNPEQLKQLAAWL